MHLVVCVTEHVIVEAATLAPSSGPVPQLVTCLRNKVSVDHVHSPFLHVLHAE